MYYDLTNSNTFDGVFDALIEYWINEELINFAFWIYGRNEETLENICYYFWLDIDDVLKMAWIEEEDEEEDED